MFGLRICVSICLYSGHFLKSNLSGPAVKRGPGRPPGTGPKQIAARLAQAQGALEVTKSGLLIEVTYSHYGCF